MYLANEIMEVVRLTAKLALSQVNLHLYKSASSKVILALLANSQLWNSAFSKQPPLKDISL